MIILALIFCRLQQKKQLGFFPLKTFQLSACKKRTLSREAHDGNATLIGFFRGVKDTRDGRHGGRAGRETDSVVRFFLLDLELLHPRPCVIYFFSTVTTVFFVCGDIGTRGERV